MISIGKAVQVALRNKWPIVALESTIISHGLPYPLNLQTAVAVEQIVKDNGCTPATIAVIKGHLTIGCDLTQLEFLALPNSNINKVSRRDLAFALSTKSMGSTTVSATMIAAHRAGIDVFVTGGIGGVHRNAENTMDISADLTELARTPVAVVCAGAKSILDIQKTLEVLETYGVSVSTIGKTNDFPAFYFPKSGFRSPNFVANAKDAAKMIYSNLQLELNSGMVFAVPIPENDAPNNMDIDIESVIQSSLAEAKKLGIRGKDTTPFLLDSLNRLTKGASLKANIALIKNNAKIGSQIAVELSKMLANNNKLYLSTKFNNSNLILSTKENNPTKNSTTAISKRPLIIGATVIDITSKLSTNTSIQTWRTTSTPNFSQFLETSTPGKTTESLGGVARNISEASFRTNGNPHFLSIINHKSKWILDQMKTEMPNIDLTLVKISESALPTATYNAILSPKGDLIAACADMQILNEIDRMDVECVIKGLRPSVVAFDANCTELLIERILETCFDEKVFTFFEPTSLAKSVKAFGKDGVVRRYGGRLDYFAPNLKELEFVVEYLKLDHHDDDYDDYDQESNFAIQNVDELLNISKSTKKLEIEISTIMQFVDTLILKLGPKGVLLAQRLHIDAIRLKHFNPHCVLTECVSVTGAGDTMAGTIISLLSQNGFEKDGMDGIIVKAMRASELSLMSFDAVSKELSLESIGGS